MRKVSDPKLIVRYALRETLGLACMGVALFWPAGTIIWWPGWATIAVMAAWILATATVILRFNPDLLAERLGPRTGAKPWDTAIMSVLGMTQLARYIVAGLDRRYGWTGGLPLLAQIAALMVCVLGYALFIWAMASNAYFSQIVRSQLERGHVVAGGGPYRTVRHPGYLGAILFELAASVLLGSWWSGTASGLASSCSSCALRWRTAPCTTSWMATKTMRRKCDIACCQASGKSSLL